MHVLTVSTVTDNNQFWAGLKAAYGHLSKPAAWVLALSDTSGTRAVNVIEHNSVEAVRQMMEQHAGAAGVTEYFELDAANAVGLGR